VKKITLAVLIIVSLMVLTLATPVFACTRPKTTIVPCKFTMVGNSVGGDFSPGKVWWTNDNSILHVIGASAKGLLFLSPTVEIGTMKNTVSFDFNTKTGIGYGIEIWDMTFIAPVYYYTGQPTGSPNPYGLGTLDGITIEKVTSVFGLVTGLGIMLPGDTTGQIIATHGTGDFEKAKLSADVIGKPMLLPSPPYPANEWDEFAYVGWDGVTPAITGTLTFHT